jgi:hypothetical protein
MLILANIYDENDNRTVGIYEIDINTLEVKIFTELEKLTYGFFMEKYHNNLVVYGNSNEAKKDLTVYTYNLSNRKTTLRINSNHKAMWVNRVINLNDKKVILNSYSIISMTKDYKNLKVEYNDDSTLIDIVYDKDKGVFYLLKGYYEERIFEVIILDKNFSEINRIKLKNKDTIPTKIFLMG